MSKHKHHASQRGEPNAPTTAHTEASPQPPNQEKTMEASKEASAEQSPVETGLEASAEVSGPTAKELAAAEEANQARALRIAAQQQEAPAPAPVNIREVAARGYDALQEQFRRHNENSKPKEYTPPPRTDRQMSALQEELEAGARRVAATVAQQAAALPNTTDLRKEGFTTPVYRPNDVVPDPIIDKPSGGAVGGTRGFSPDV